MGYLLHLKINTKDQYNNKSLHIETNMLRPPNTDGLINCLLQPGLFYLSP